MDLADALRRPLAFAAKDGFAHLDKVRDLGATLRTAADRLIAAGAPASIVEWRRALERFDALGRDQREVLIARGLRLLVSVGEVKAAEPKAKPPAQTGNWSDSVRVLPGCGPKIEELLRERGIETVGDLLALLPRRYQDRRDVKPLAQLAALPDGADVVTRGRVVRARAVPRRFFELVVEDGDARLTARWFRFHGGFAKRFEKGDWVILAGPMRRYKGEPQMAHPDVLADGQGGVRPVYPMVEGVPPGIIVKLARAAVEKYADGAEEPLPDDLRERLALPRVADALRLLHSPPQDVSPAAVRELDEARTPAHKRLAFDEFFLLQIGLGRRRGATRREPGLPCAADASAIRGVLPFALTGAQQRVIGEIESDLAREVPMLRLLQGDVGAGKTVIALAAAHIAIASGYQAALMAPTEILAEQHARTLEPWVKALGWRMALLTASTPRGARESLLALLAAGKIQLLIGTHALLAERVDFARLGLAIVDEQHRFGVAQRARLREKGETGAHAPHLMVMTATPIPRTLALTAYGDLDVSVLDEMPPGRTPPETRVFVGPRARARAYRDVARELAAGKQGFVVCPLVAESEKVDYADAVSTSDQLRAQLEPARIGLIHGRMPAPEKDDVMRRFRAREIDLLVATTVIEVGVDIPDATIMVVEHAERFGLAQLHQLRGRVGRGAGTRGRCFLLTPHGGGEIGAERLRVMATTTDGFKIAEADLALRGFGELFGTRQAGIPRLRFGDLRRDLELLALARAEAFALLETDPDLAHHPSLRAAIERRAAERIFGEEAG